MSELSEGGRSIVGLKWASAWRIPNGNDSHVIPIPTLRPVNLVFKGDEDFSYGHYGVHLGQMDRLMFLGPSTSQVTAYFIDCRAESATFRTRLTVRFTPNSAQILEIPPGVAHTFDTRAVSTLNWYSMMLPEPEEWLSPEASWTVQGDIINIPMDVAENDLPALRANRRPASELFYGLIAEEQKRSLKGLQHEYPFTQDVTFADGSQERLKFWRQLGKRRHRAEWEPIEGIVGAGWRSNLVVWTGEVSGYVPVLDRRPKHLIDHGETLYTHDAFGIHTGGDDHLIFLGPSHLKARCELVDCRKGSETCHQSVSFDLSPDPLRTLIIPRGVAHRFEHMEGIFTINQPLTYLPSEGGYEPGHDVIDWPIARRPFPELEVNSLLADDDYYKALVARQAAFLAEPPRHATPTILLTKDADGNAVRVAIRELIG
jgi:dTDP-4-dehydrorhamnose 3,5-epimerase-like enzyme